MSPYTAQWLLDRQKLTSGNGSGGWSYGAEPTTPGPSVADDDASALTKFFNDTSSGAPCGRSDCTE